MSCKDKSSESKNFNNIIIFNLSTAELQGKSGVYIRLKAGAC